MTKKDNKNIILYESDDGQISFNVNVIDETVWLNQQQIAELFEVQRPAITKHLSNIYKTKELKEKSTSSILEHMGENGQIYKTKHYNLDVVISVGYRVNSVRATQFRIWATQVLKQYMMSGFAINEKRIRNIEEKLDNLSTSLKNELRAEIKEINKTLLNIANRPITINNQIRVGSDELEKKVIELLDKLMDKTKSDKKLTTQLKKVKEEIKASEKDEESRNRILQFLQDIGDEKSEIHKTIKGIKAAKKILSELIKFGGKLRGLLF